MMDTLAERASSTIAGDTTASDIVGTYKRAPMRFVSGSGVELFDDTGKAYLDLSSGIAVNALGYGIQHRQIFRIFCHQFTA